MAFLDKSQELINEKNNLTLTENGAVVYKSTNSVLLDFNSSVTLLRTKTVPEVAAEFEKVYNENPVDAITMMFYMRDCRGIMDGNKVSQHTGKGERNIFEGCMAYLGTKHPHILMELMPLIPEYGRWDDMNKLALCKNEEVAKYARDIIVEQLIKDKKNLEAGKNISLCGKWAPSIQSKDANDLKLAQKLERRLNMTHREYRQFLSSLREKINVTERNLSLGLKDNINLEHLTSTNQLKLQKAITNAVGEEKVKEYQEKVASGEANINASVLTPVDIIYKYRTEMDYSYKEIESLENLWENLPEDLCNQSGMLVIRDGSGSMETPMSTKTKLKAIDVADALSIYCSEHLTGEFKDKFITFSSHPEIVDLNSCTSLCEKIETLSKYDDYSNTDIKQTFNLLLETAVRNSLKQEELPKTLLIVSDMEFDEAMTEYDYDTRKMYSQATLFDGIRDEWKTAGYEMPNLCFWNVNARELVIPEIKENSIIISGYSTDNLNMILNGDFDINKMMNQILTQERYKPVREIAKEAVEREKNDLIIERK